MRTLALKKLAPGVPLFCQMNSQANKDLLLAAGVGPSRVLAHDAVIMGLLAQNVQTPGVFPLIAGLLTTHTDTSLPTTRRLPACCSACCGKGRGHHQHHNQGGLPAEEGPAMSWEAEYRSSIAKVSTHPHTAVPLKTLDSSAA